MNEVMKTTASAPVATGGFDFFNQDQFATMQRVCKLFASSELVPDMYKISEKNPEQKAVANCLIAIETAQRIGASPLMVMQNMIIIYGRPSWSSKFLISTVNSCGRFEPLQYKFEKCGKVGKITINESAWENGKKVTRPVEYDFSNLDNLTCVAFTTKKGSTAVLESTPVSVKLAVQEGWYTKNGSKWQTMTRQMLAYRAASFWVSMYAPELSMGMHTAEETADIISVDAVDVSEVVEAEKAVNANREEIGLDVETNIVSEHHVENASDTQESVDMSAGFTAEEPGF